MVSKGVRLDQAIVARGLLQTRSQAESYISLGQVKVNGVVINKAGAKVSANDQIELAAKEQYVSRAGLKLASVAKTFHIDFQNTVVLDVGSSTGGFTDYALQHGAKKVIAVEVGTNQMHPSLRNDPRIELHEKTDIRDVRLRRTESGARSHELGKTQPSHASFVILPSVPDIVVIDVSFISLRLILPHVSKLISHNSIVIAMVKPQFEAGGSHKHKGVIKNDKMRREILKDFEHWVQNLFIIIDKADSKITGVKGNLERFYVLKLL